MTAMITRDTSACRRVYELALAADDAVRIQAAAILLAALPVRKSANRAATTYGLKHDLEHAIGYLTLAEFDAACLQAGLKLTPVGGGSPNSHTNVTAGAINWLWDWAHAARQAPLYGYQKPAGWDEAMGRAAALLATRAVSA